MKTEIWKTIEEYPNYEVSNIGNVRSKDRQSIKGYRKGKGLTIGRNYKGYSVVSLYKTTDSVSRKKERFVHRLVAIAFIPNPENKPQVNHINGIKSDNCIDNLEWNTCSENVQHAFDSGIKKSITGEKHPSAKFTNAIAEIIRSKYKKGKVNYASLAKEYNVNPNTIGLIIRGRIYAE